VVNFRRKYLKKIRISARKILSPEEVYDAGLCSECGVCGLYGDASGFEDVDFGLKPINSTNLVLPRFNNYCPGVRVDAPRTKLDKSSLGPYLEAYACFASDEELRYGGASGGVLTALLIHSMQSSENPVLSAQDMGMTAVQKLSYSMEEVTRTQGSQYRPTPFMSNSNISDLLNTSAAVLRPCQVSAISNVEVQTPLLISFYCAGVPSRSTFEGLIKHMGINDLDQIHSVRFRGRGWPGKFQVEDRNQVLAKLTYEESWGYLGKGVLERCNICPDAIGDKADIVGADPWSITDGRPSFEESPGVTAIFLRTEKGKKAFDNAVKAGKIIVMNPLNIESFISVQKHQFRRRGTSIARNLAHILITGYGLRIKGYSKQLLTVSPWEILRDFLRSLRKFRNNSRIKSSEI
jgi:coenzyme F420 hydrogenase subunit beta